MGLQMRASAHGILGFAAMSSGTVRDAVRLAARYSVIRTTAIALSTHVGDGFATLAVDAHEALRGAREGYAFAILIGFWRMGQVLSGRDYDASLEFAFPKPAYFDRFTALLPPTSFDRPANQLVLRDLGLLEAPLTMADESSLRLAREQCEQLLQSLGLDGRLVPRVRSALARKPDDVPSLKSVARSLRLSPRTFRRHLEAEGLTFSALADEERRRRALHLLRSNELSVREVGERLGYSDVANFTRAFRRWTGKTPTAYRNEG